MRMRTKLAATLVAAAFLALAAPRADAACSDDPARDQLAAAYHGWLIAIASESAELDPALFRIRAAETAAALASLEGTIATVSSASTPLPRTENEQAARAHAALTTSCRPTTG
jgi:hypothetical protein